jgi:hypothetical protein
MVWCKVKGFDVPRHCGHCEEFKKHAEEFKKHAKEKIHEYASKDKFSLQFPTEPIDLRLMKEKE